MPGYADPGFDTLALHAGAAPDPATGARAVPIHLTTSFVFESSDQAAALFNMERAGHVYSRISNPTNAVLEHRGATLGILMTDGFEDVLAIGRHKRSDMYNLKIGPEEPLFLAPRRQIRGIPERLDAAGRVLIPLDEAAVVAAVTDLVEQHGVNAIVVCYLFAYLDPRHEHPEDRQGPSPGKAWAHPELLVYVRQRRPQLVVAALTGLAADGALPGRSGRPGRATA